MDDQEIWQKLCAEVKPLAKKFRDQQEVFDAPKASKVLPSLDRRHVADKSTPQKAEISTDDIHRLQKKIVRGAVASFSTYIARPIRETPEAFTAMDGSRAHKFRTGKVAIEAVLDLHGQTEQHASQSFAGFFLRARKRRLRCVLVITGHGEGVLQRALAKWLESREVKPYLMGVTPMPQHKGGKGAYALYLRKG